MDRLDTLHVVGLTGEGEVALLRTLTGHETIVLPGITVSQLGDGRELQSVNRLLAKLGYEARELVAMSRYGIPNGSGGRSSLLMAPVLTRRGIEAASVPGLALHEIAIARAAGWLREQKARGARVDPRVWAGLLLVERHFPAWARERLHVTLAALRRRAFAGTVVDEPVPKAPRESARGA
ncbi:MAG TPA: hypothetical protein VGH97_05825 [Thermoanaerobaculia bacterium]